MTTKHRIIPNLYKDSVALMAITSKVLAVEGVTEASVVMGTETNLANLVEAGLGDGVSAKPTDLVVAVAGDAEACDAALELAEQLLAEQPAGDGPRVEEPPSSIGMAVARDPAVNFALVSVPGDYAAAEAVKALRLGLDVMVFSDNVPVDQELEMKQLAASLGRMVMGPDCGTAIVNGLPLGFANVVRRGPIGVVGASGTGTQEVTVRIHQRGSGVSQALGTGGHDLSEHIGGISMLHGLRALEQDPATEVVVLVSKPPAERVAKAVLEQARSMATPVVVIFLGADPATFSDERIHGAATLAEAADLAVALAEGRPAVRAAAEIRPEDRKALDDAVRRMAPTQRYVRGIFAGGTFCFEAQLLCLAQGIQAHSNTPVEGNLPLADLRRSEGHTIIDMGDDEFTQGRPHPMIDPSLRNERIAQDTADPETAVLLVDVVLGYGSTLDPVSGLAAAIGRARADAKGAGRHLAVVAHVCGTDLDPQDRTEVVAQLAACGALVAGSNAEAATWSAYLARRLADR